MCYAPTRPAWGSCSEGAWTAATGRVRGPQGRCPWPTPLRLAATPRLGAPFSDGSPGSSQGDLSGASGVLGCGGRKVPLLCLFSHFEQTSERDETCPAFLEPRCETPPCTKQKPPPALPRPGVSQLSGRCGGPASPAHSRGAGKGGTPIPPRKHRHLLRSCSRSGLCECFRGVFCALHEGP